MDAFIEFIKEWGYLAVFLGSLVEGESVILTASAMASQGYLSILKVSIIAFIGTTLADQFLYMVGWHYGEGIFKRFPKIHTSLERAFDLLHKYDMYFIIACRFIYGIRVASALVIGAAKIPPTRFVLLNLLSAFIWTVVSCGGGYYAGGFVFNLFHQSGHIQKYIFMTLGCVIFLILIILKIKSHYKKS